MAETTPPPPQGQEAKGVTLMRPVIVALLYLLNLVLGFSAIVGLVLAYVWRADEDTTAWERTHYVYLIRTFWIGLIVMVAAVIVLLSLAIGIDASSDTRGADAGITIAMVLLVLFALFMLAWYCIRCILSLVKAGERRPMPNPRTWLF
ncbi:DUF4870 family protein [Aurantiacibacter aquimixticola]|uniref:DUF4870 domain-containing protein n=1 Tax=Aurantiacibacter aquimixticola TaxID=1958945 RepID=A0A419RU86_9SPHN|nr:hypothetical protein [Aurantiacibacter aquimixticola]RJY09351.1 hypothetical protein D6201_08280 [Aurantiacibacter aquimixticola]